jgi:DnaJ family protein C protein 27
MDPSDSVLRPRGINANAASVIASLPKVQTARLKIISMGAECTGKSCLIKRYCEERFIPKYIATIGIDYGVKRVPIGQQQVAVNFWDLAGSPEFVDVRNEFYKDAQGALLVYDVTNPRSFAALDVWLAEAQKHNVPKDLVIAVCANKTDLGTGARKIQEAEGRRWAESRGYAYFETSANTGANVASVMEWLFRESFNSSARR